MEHENIVRLLDVQHRRNKILLVLEYLEFNLWEFMQFMATKTDQTNVLTNTGMVIAIAPTSPYVGTVPVNHGEKPEKFLRTRDIVPKIAVTNVKAKEDQYILLQILHSVAYCHSQKIIHRDLKPRNLLIGRNKILKIADFGMSRSVDVPLKIYTKNVASLCYMAPEILFGVGQYSAPDLAEEIPGLEPAGVDLLSKMLCLDTGKRITARDALKHAYLEMYRSHPNFLMAIPFFYSAIA
ncbi:cell division control protein 2 homolog [Camellia sinensis]|uniref:cell division control protein 2 homolog n=1 Tax=Camellia sinensis TaxID=4442 RepID=UPI0010369B84|nr:cell division control protein 2 homolog [Camellia sinensis]